jgi:hypothetical protein
MQTILSERRSELINRIKEDYVNSMFHSKGFVYRLLGEEATTRLINATGFDLSDYSNRIKYEGFPYLGYLGFAIGSGWSDDFSQPLAEAFISGLKRLQDRSRGSFDEFLEDDVAVLGVADGIAKLSNTKVQAADHVRHWFIGLLDDFPRRALWSERMRDLAADLLDERGRLREAIMDNDPVKSALELSLHSLWPQAFRNSSYPDEKAINHLLKSIVSEPLPSQGDIEQATVWLKALDIVVDKSIEKLSPTVSDIVRLLAGTQHSFKRWVWETQSRRSGSGPACWLIDNEYHVQSFLWAVLYPIFGPELRDETYLPSYGQVQPRYDLGIVNLKLIIEVKIARERRDFELIEEQVAGDLGLYFKEPERFDRMVVYIYDDCDRYYAEKYDTLKNALKGRERIEDVVIIRRPSMIPNRGQRKPQIDIQRN